jgi:hypothetical protein
MNTDLTAHSGCAATVSESRHTPGPWLRDKYGAVRTTDDKDVLFRNMACLSAGSDERMAEAEANTDLAAAAPQMLAALERAKAWIEDAMEERGWPRERVENPPEGSHLHAMNAAIAAARSA